MNKELLKLTIKMKSECPHYYSRHYAGDNSPIRPCPHYNRGKCELGERLGNIFPKSCIALILMNGSK